MPAAPTSPTRASTRTAPTAPEAPVSSKTTPAIQTSPTCDFPPTPTPPLGGRSRSPATARTETQAGRHFRAMARIPPVLRTSLLATEQTPTLPPLVSRTTDRKARVPTTPSRTMA